MSKNAFNIFGAQKKKRKCHRKIKTWKSLLQQLSSDSEDSSDSVSSIYSRAKAKDKRDIKKVPGGFIRKKRNKGYTKRTKKNFLRMKILKKASEVK